MVTPFASGGGSAVKLPIDIGVLGDNVSGTSKLLDQIFPFDFSLVNKTAYFESGFQHAATSAAAGNMKLILYDYTNATTLIVFSSNTSSATNTDSSTQLSIFTTFAKPAGFAKIGVQLQNMASDVLNIRTVSPAVWFI